jgi:hypothetical protein
MMKNFVSRVAGVGESSGVSLSLSHPLEMFVCSTRLTVMEYEIIKTNIEQFSRLTVAVGEWVVKCLEYSLARAPFLS